MIGACMRAMYQVVLRLYPAEFRQAVGPALLADFEDGLRARTGDRARFGLAQMLDLIRNLGREWRAPSGPRRPGSRSEGSSWIGAIGHDVVAAARSLRRDPLFAASSILVLGLGLAGVVSVYGLVEAVLLEPLPYPEAGRLVSMVESYRVDQRKSVAYPNFVDWQTRNRSLSELGARAWNSVNLTGEGPARTIDAMGITPELLSVLGVQTVRGRLFSKEEAEESLRVVLVSEGFWRDSLGSDPAVTSRTLMLDGLPYTIVGVMEHQAEFPLAGAQMWMPLRTALSPNNLTDRTNHPGIEAIGRLAAGVDIEQARADMDRIARELAEEYPDANAEAGIVLRPLRERVVSSSAATLWVLLATVVIVMLAICANVSGLMLARATRRHGELAVRAALGAGRGRIATQLMAEALIVAACAGALGVATASAALSRISESDGLGIARLGVVRLDASVAGFGLLFAIGCGMLVATTSLARLRKLGSAAALRGAVASRGIAGTRHTVRRALVIAQVALAVMLLAGAGLMVRSLTNLAAADLGLSPGEVITAYVGPPQSQYPSNESRVELYRAMVREAQTLPGVVRVAGGDPLPLTGRNNQWTLSNDGFAHIDELGHRVEVARIMPGYFETLGIELLEGRDFREDDTAESPTVVIDRTLADFLFPDGGAVGQRVRFRGPAEDRPWHTVVGVVGHVKNYGVRNDSRGQLYLPYTASAWGMTLLVETDGAGAAATVVDGLRRALADLDPELPLTGVNTVGAYVDDSVAAETLLTRTLSGFAAVALIVSVIGLYGVVAYSVALRTREFGIRIALGARSARVLGSVVLEGAVLGVVGAALGLLGAVAGSRWLASTLYEVPPTDPWTLGPVALAMLAVAVGATIVPAVRATRVQPTEALRA